MVNKERKPDNIYILFEVMSMEFPSFPPLSLLLSSSLSIHSQMHDSDLFPSLTLYHIHFYFTPSMFLLIILSISPLFTVINSSMHTNIKISFQGHKFEGKFLICFDNLANRSYGYDLDDKRASLSP